MFVCVRERERDKEREREWGGKMASAYDKGLVDAAKRGDSMGVMKALRGGVDADLLPSQWSSESDMRALHYAAYSNAADIAKLLLDAGADANRKQGVRDTKTECRSPSSVVFNLHVVCLCVVMCSTSECLTVRIIWLSDRGRWWRQMTGLLHASSLRCIFQASRCRTSTHWRRCRSKFAR